MFDADLVLYRLAVTVDVFLGRAAGFKFDRDVRQVDDKRLQHICHHLGKVFRGFFDIKTDRGCEFDDVFVFVRGIMMTALACLIPTAIFAALGRHSEIFFPDLECT